MDCKYLINMKDGRLVFRNEETDKQVNLKPVPDSVVKMIMRGEVSERDVINAISAKMKESGDFDFQAYVAELAKLNVRVSNPQEGARKVELKDRSDEMVGADEIKAAAEKGADAKAAKKERVRKIMEKLDAPAAGGEVNL